MNYKRLRDTHYLVYDNGQIFSDYTNVWRKTWIDGSGYESIRLCINGNPKNYYVHRLVYAAFGGPLIKGMWINHKDGIKTNNHINNLEQVTPSENHFHASRVLKRNYARGLATGTGLLSPEALQAVYELLDIGWSQRKIARAFGVSQSAISQQLNK